MIRQAVAAGTFYPGTESAIKKLLSAFIPQGKIEKSKALAVVVPHAGYIYSGEVAVAVLSQIEIPGQIIILGPNHTGFGPALSIFAKGTWKTPLGTITINEKISENLLKNCDGLNADTLAHTYEHCLEVQLPILQYFAKDFTIVPIVVGLIDQKKIVKLAADIARTIQEMQIENNVLFIASTDMTHYESQAQAAAKDKLAIEMILGLNSQGLLETIAKHDISMCGVYPTAIVLEIAKILGAKKARLIKYDTSAKASSDYEAVVGYAGIAIT